MHEQETSLREQILLILSEVASDKLAPPAARVAAARTLAEMAGLIGRVQSSGLDTGTQAETELTSDELDRELARLHKARSQAGHKAK
jgi:hypothetical protein